MKNPIAIYHADCFDGFCSAWLMYHFCAGGTGIEYYPAKYDEPPPDVTGRDVWILDFSYPRDMLEAMYKSARNLMVFDHHKSSQENLQWLSYCTFDMEKSGAQLTWDWVRRRQRWQVMQNTSPWLVEYTADRDLWKWELPDSKEVNAALRSYPMDFKVWDQIYAEESPETLKRDGAAILRADEITINMHVARAREVEFDGHRVLSVNATSLFSEIAGKLAEGREFGMCWFERDDGVRQYSLRSRDGGIDVSEVAKRHGGGGHMRAAGFEARAS